MSDGERTPDKQTIEQCAEDIAEKVSKGAVNHFRQELQGCLSKEGIYEKQAKKDPSLRQNGSTNPLYRFIKALNSKNPTDFHAPLENQDNMGGYMGQIDTRGVEAEGKVNEIFALKESYKTPDSFVVQANRSLAKFQPTKWLQQQPEESPTGLDIFVADFNRRAKQELPGYEAYIDGKKVKIRQSKS